MEISQMFSYKNEKIDQIIRNRDFITNKDSTQKALELLSLTYGPLPKTSLRTELSEQDQGEANRCECTYSKAEAGLIFDSSQGVSFSLYNNEGVYQKLNQKKSE